MAGLDPLSLARNRPGVLPPEIAAGIRALHQVRAQLAAHNQELIVIAAPDTPAAAVLGLAGLDPGGEFSWLAGRSRAGG